MNTRRIHALQTDNQLYFLDNEMKVVATTYKLPESPIPYISVEDQSWYEKVGCPNYVWVECEISDALMSESEVQDGKWLQDSELKYRHFRYKLKGENQIVVSHTLEEKQPTFSSMEAAAKNIVETHRKKQGDYQPSISDFQAEQLVIQGMVWQEEQYKDIMEGNLMSWMLTTALRKMSGDKLRNLADSIYERLPENMRPITWKKVKQGNAPKEEVVALTSEYASQNVEFRKLFMEDLHTKFYDYYIPVSELISLPKEE